MKYLVIKKESIDKIYTSEEPEIEFLSFSSREKAQEYLGIKNNNIIDVFTDGACSNNGRENAKAGIGIYFKENDPRNISQRIVGKQTNNMAELWAVIKAFEILRRDISDSNNIINIYTDSEYVIKCANSYGEKCEQINWKKRNGVIPNVELVKKVYELNKTNINVSIKWVRAHTNNKDYLSEGNKGADLLAVKSLDH